MKYSQKPNYFCIFVSVFVLLLKKADFFTMKLIIYTLLIMIGSLLVTCSNNEVRNDSKDTGILEDLSEDDMTNSFYEYEIKPYYIVNNVDFNSRNNSDKKNEELIVSGHMIQWINYNDEITVQIDGTAVPLKNEITLNQSWGIGNDSVNFVNRWDRMTYFKYFDQEILGIGMTADPCNGTGCSVCFHLLYDLKKRKASFFAVFRTDFDIKLYDLKNNGDVSYISRNYDDLYDELTGYQGIVITYNLYMMDGSGNFVLQKNAGNEAFYIKHVTDSTGSKIEENWIYPVKVNK